MSEICKLKLYVVGDEKIILCPKPYQNLIKSNEEAINELLDYKIGIGSIGILFPKGKVKDENVYEHSVNLNHMLLSDDDEHTLDIRYFQALSAVYYSCLYGLFSSINNCYVNVRSIRQDGKAYVTDKCLVGINYCQYSVIISSDHKTFATGVKFIADINVELDNLECIMPEEEEYEEEYEYFDSIPPNFGINKDDLKLLNE